MGTTSMYSGYRIKALQKLLGFIHNVDLKKWSYYLTFANKNFQSPKTFSKPS